MLTLPSSSIYPHTISPANTTTTLQLQKGEGDIEHFDEQYLSVQEYKNLGIKDEIDQYLRLNSGLKFSPGELLFAMHSINPVVDVCYKMTKKTDAFIPPMEQITLLCKIMGKECTGKNQGRHNEELVLSLLSYNTLFRIRGKSGVKDDHFAVSAADTLVQTVRKYSGEVELDTLSDPQPQPLLPRFVRILNRTLDLYAELKNYLGKTKVTEFRLLIICIMAIAEIPEAKLNPPLFAKFMDNLSNHPTSFDQGTRKKGAKSVSGQKLHDILTSSYGQIKEKTIVHFLSAYETFYSREVSQGPGPSSLPPPPPPPPPRAGRHPAPSCASSAGRMVTGRRTAPPSNAMSAGGPAT